ncbi:MAG: sensor histidine kinase [Chloroflexota bacterium]
MPSHSHLPLHRPPWWPENEAWPPRRPWQDHKPFFRRVGCLFGFFNFAGAALFVFAVVYALNYFGVTHISFAAFSWLLIPFRIAVAFFLVGLLLFAAFRLRRMSAPLDAMLAASEKVSQGDYSVRLEEQGWPETRSLARGFNAMVDKLQASDRQRRAMLADVSHELRTPLTVIHGSVEGMLDGLYPADERQLKSILEETQLLSRLVDDLRTLALAESGTLQVKREPTDLAGLIRETVAGFGSRAELGSVKLETALAETPPVEVDPVRVREILSNLLGNALRYSPRGGMIRVSYDGFTVSVEDEGPGIPPADLPRVFERFYKSSDSGGMGLGLSIARLLAEAHGGTIRAENRSGGGTRISFTLSP